MAVYRLEAAPGMPLDSRYVDSIDLTVMNIGGESFDMLLQGNGPHGVFCFTLFHMAAGETRSFPGMPTYRQPFSVLLVSNYHTYHTTNITLNAKIEGATAALITHENFERMH